MASDQADRALHVDQLKFRWPGRDSFQLSVPDLQVATGEKVLLLGRSGSGKTTLLSLIGGIVSPQTGRVLVAGTNFADIPAKQRDRYRAEAIGIIFQQFNLLPYATVADNIALPLRFAPERRQAAGDIDHEARRLCLALALPAQAYQQTAGRLSVGQQQRVAVARALIGTPPLILADEPTSALDAQSQENFISLLFDQVTHAGSAMLMVSHDEKLATRFDRVITMEDISVREPVAS